jgi:hypothetical protein
MRSFVHCLISLTQLPNPDKPEQKAKPKGISRKARKERQEKQARLC